MKELSSGLVVTIDGPAASGKGTLAKLLAKHYSWTHLDTGLTYRAVAHEMLNSGYELTDVEKAIAAAKRVNFSNLNKDILCKNEIGEAASTVSTIYELREILVKRQQEFIDQHKLQGIILDGRDAGTVIYPAAPIKFFMVADIKERAKRRYEELGQKVTFDEILSSLEKRDLRDCQRKNSPLVKAPDAHLMDTSGITIEEAFLKAKKTIDHYLNQG